jgi:adenosine kinase
MSVMLCGSLAFDTVMVFKGRFKEHILADRIHMLSVAFLVPEMRRNFGGVAGNIAYNLALLGHGAEVLATVGEDFGPYADWLDRMGISRRYIQPIPDTYTAQAFITTDLDDNQITAFHPGAMSHSGTLNVPADAGLRMGLVGPDSREGMMAHARQFKDAGIPFIFDVGQGLPMFDGTELLQFVDQADWVVVNDYEGQLLEERTGLSPRQIAERCQAYVVTRGAQGSIVYAAGEQHEIPVVPPERIADPTGCGDAYRAGLIYGLSTGLDWPTTARLASLIGSIKIEHHGTQNHRFTLDEIKDRFVATFGYRF